MPARGADPGRATGARAQPIYQTTSFVFDSADHAATLFNLQTFGNVYSRISNPTVAALEERVAALEGGRAALAAATGMAAQMVALLTLSRAGDHIVAARTLYGGTYSQLAVTFAQFGIDATFVDADDPAAFRARQAEYQGVLRRDDRQSAAQRLRHRCARRGRARRRRSARHRQHARLALPVPAVRARRRHRRPLAHQVPGRTRHDDGRHRRRVGQVPLGNGNFPQMTEPSRGYHGVRFHETFGDFGFTMKTRMETMRTLGPTLSPLSAFLLLQGIETLHLRMPRHCESALAVARHLARHPRSNGSTIRCWPGAYALARKYLPRGGRDPDLRHQGGRRGAGERFIEAVEFCRTSPTSATPRRW